VTVLRILGRSEFILCGMDEALAEVTTLFVPDAPLVEGSAASTALDAQELLEVVNALLEQVTEDGPLEVMHQLLDAIVELVPGRTGPA
jgi:hypothetical protein